MPDKHTDGGHLPETGDNVSVADILAKLADLQAHGVLSAEEFVSATARLLIRSGLGHASIGDAPPTSLPPFLEDQGSESGVAPVGTRSRGRRAGKPLLAGACILVVLLVGSVVAFAIVNHAETERAFVTTSPTSGPTSESSTPGVSSSPSPDTASPSSSAVPTPHTPGGHVLDAMHLRGVQRYDFLSTTKMNSIGRRFCGQARALAPLAGASMRTMFRYVQADQAPMSYDLAVFTTYTFLYAYCGRLVPVDY